MSPGVGWGGGSEAMFLEEEVAQVIIYVKTANKSSCSSKWGSLCTRDQEGPLSLVVLGLPYHLPARLARQVIRPWTSVSAPIRGRGS